MRILLGMVLGLVTVALVYVGASIGPDLMRLAMQPRDAVPLAQAAPVPGPGSFVETEDALLAGLAPRGFEYEPPAVIGTAHTMIHDGRERTWRMLAPSTAVTGLPAAIVLLHGSQRDGRSMLDMFRGLPATSNVVLIAPDSTDPAGWSDRDDGAEFLAALLAEAQGAQPFDPARVYLFGHSAGAGHALGLVAGGAEGFAAVAGHAGQLRAQRARNVADGVPVRLYVGDDDHLFPIEAVRTSAQALAEAGHDAEMVVMRGHTHWFYAAGPRIARDVWGWFEGGTPAG